MRTGFVLPTCLILLVALAMVATGAMQASGFESHMAGNAVDRAEAFEASESVRRLFEPVLHAALDGDAASLEAAAAAGWTLADATGAALATNDDEADHCATPFTTADGSKCTLRVDATYERDLAARGEAPAVLRGEIAVFRVRSGSDAASYFYVESRGASVGGARTAAQVVTAAIVRHVPGATTPVRDGEPTPDGEPALEGEPAPVSAPAPAGAALRNGEIDWRERRP